MDHAKYVGFSPEVRISHHIHMLFFITIALTGFYIHQPENLLGYKTFKWIGGFHTISAIFLYASFFFRLYYAFVSGDYVNFRWLKEDLRLAKEWVGYYLFLRQEKPAQRKYNPLQKGTYYSMIFLLILQGLLGLGLLQSERFGWVLAIFGGRQPTRVWHFFLAVLLSALVVIHIYLVFTSADQREREAMFALGRIRERP